MREVLIRSPSIAFAFGLTASQFEAEAQGCLRQPVHRPSLGYGGTAALTTAASPSAGVDRAHRVPVSRPAAGPTAGAAIRRRVALETGWAGLAGVGWVSPFHHHAR